MREKKKIKGRGGGATGDGRGMETPPATLTAKRS